MFRKQIRYPVIGAVKSDVANLNKGIRYPLAVPLWVRNANAVSPTLCGSRAIWRLLPEH
jgi:hypothetical protein